MPMKQAAYSLFETPLGWCGIAWSEIATANAPYAVTLLQLPEANAELTESRIARNCGGPQRSELPSQILSISSRVQRHLHGDLQNFRDIPVDLDSAGPFVRRV